MGDEGGGRVGNCKSLEEWVETRGKPLVMYVDISQATQSKELQSVCASKGVVHQYSHPDHHTSLGFVEWFNQTLLNRLRKMWREYLRKFARVVRKQ